MDQRRSALKDSKGVLNCMKVRGEKRKNQSCKRKCLSLIQEGGFFFSNYFKQAVCVGKPTETKRPPHGFKTKPKENHLSYVFLRRISTRHNCWKHIGQHWLICLVEADLCNVCGGLWVLLSFIFLISFSRTISMVSVTMTPPVKYNALPGQGTRKRNTVKTSFSVLSTACSSHPLCYKWIY